jgi:hypothetical protein
LKKKNPHNCEYLSLPAPRSHTLQDQTTALASDYTRADGTVFTGKHSREKKITDSMSPILDVFIFIF